MNAPSWPVILLFLVTAALPLRAASPVIISEFMAANSSTLADEDGVYSDWIEIHNTGPTNVNLLNWSLTDTAANLTKWRFPATNLPPGGFLVVFASDPVRRVPGAPLHTGFGLNASGEYLALVQPDGTTIATEFRPVFGPQVQDVSYGFGAELASRVLFSTGAVAAVRVPAEGAQGTTWTAREFDDSSWLAATNGLGYETGQSEINAGAGAAAIQASNPLLHFRLNETNGTTANDDGSLGAAAQGALLNGVVLNQSGAHPPTYPGFESDNRAIRCDGVDDKIDVPYHAALNSNIFSVELWAKVNGGAGTFRCPLASRDDFPQRGYIIYAGSDNLWQFWTGTTGAWQPLSSGSNVVLGQWTHLVGTYDGTTKRFYVNGTLAASIATPLVPNTARVLRVGAGATEGAGALFFNGDVDEVAVYGRALSGPEVLQHYQAALTGAGPTNGGPATNFNFTACIQSDLRTALHNINASVYARFPFVITNLAEVDRLTLRLKYDDAFVAYVNGLEVASAHAPLPEDLTWNSAALERRANSEAVTFQEFDLSEARGGLVPGTNMLALHGLNFGSTNVDFLLVPELVITTSGQLSPTPRYFTVPTPGAVNGTGTADLGPVITDVRFTPALPARPLDTDSITVTARISPAFAPVTNITLRYRVMFGITNALAMLDNGASGDGAAGDGVFGAIIPAAASTPGQLVRFFVTASDALGRTSRWPLLGDPLDSPEFLGTVVAQPAVASALPIWEWFAASTSAANTPAGTRGALFLHGEFYDNVGIRSRGGATSLPSQKFDFNSGYHGRVHEGLPRVEEANLNGSQSDPTLVRPPLAFQTYAVSGHPAPAAFPVLMRANGNADRVAYFVEQMDERFLDRSGLDRNGALYKFVQRNSLNPVLTDPNDGVEKKTRLAENRADLQAVCTALQLTNSPAQLAQRAAFLFDHFNLPALMNQLALRSITLDADDVRKNFYLYRDTLGNREWTILPWDKDWTFGVTGDGGTFLRHPYFGDRAHRKDNALQWSLLYEAVFTDARLRELYLRRLRTAMDTWLQPPGTAVSNSYFAPRVDHWYRPMFPHLPGASNEVNNIKNVHIPQRRTDLYVTYAATNTAAAAANRLVPAPQPSNLVVTLAAIEFNPSSRNQAEEYIGLSNAQPFAVDISGWRLEGGVEHTFAPGTVIGSNGVLYVSPDVNAFRARSTGPRGGQQLLVQGNYRGQLSARGETLALSDASGRLVTTNAYPGAPSDAQRFLRVTELMYRPSPLAGNATDPDLFEFMELRNISPVTTLDLHGVRLTNGVDFAFAGSAVTNLPPGARVLVVRSLAAFAARYDTNALLIAGSWTGALDNGGERLVLLDAHQEEVLDFSYDNGWHPITDGHGFSLVVVDEAAEPDSWNSPTQWRPSAQSGGAPGLIDPPAAGLPSVRITEVLTHTDPPQVDAIELHNPDPALPAPIGGWFLSDDFGQPKKFRIPDATSIPPGGFVTFTETNFNRMPGVPPSFSLSSLGDEVFVFSGDAATNLTGYVHGFDFGPAANGVSLGRHVTSVGEEHFVAQSSNTLDASNALPRVGPVVLNEIMYHPPDVFVEDFAGPRFEDNNSDEFIELLNVTGTNVPLFDPALPANVWRLRDAVSFSFPTNFTLPAGGFVLLVNFDPATNAATLASFRTRFNVPANIPVLGPYGGQLDNSSEPVELVRPDDPVPDGPDAGTVPLLLVDRVRYRDSAPWPAPPDGGGASLQRRVAAAYGDDPGNWYATTFTPGRPSDIGSPPIIVTQPSSLAVLPNAGALFTVGIAGVGPFTYQWHRNGMAIPGAASSSYSIANVEPVHLGDYSVVVGNTGGSVTSSVASLSFVIAPAFTLHPQSQTVDVGGTASFTAAVSGTAPTLQWFFNGTTALPGANSPTLVLAPVATNQSGNYRLVASNPAGSVTSSVAQLTVIGFTLPATLIPTGSVWRYLDNGSDQGTAWSQLAFNDSGWSNGPAQLGYGDGDERTVVGFGPNTANRYITTYFRRTFTVSDPGALASLTVRVLRDDGAIVHLNGGEIFRTAMPEGEASFNTRANVTASGADETVNFYPSSTLAPARLVPGNNVLAIEIHQVDPTSSDISFDLELLATLKVLPPPVTAAWSPTSGFSLSFPTVPGVTYHLRASTNLVDWISLGTVPGTGGRVYFTDPASTSMPHRFYHVRPSP